MWERQLMHLLLGGTPAKEATSTNVWLQQQSMPRSRTSRSMLIGTGCIRATSTLVTYDERASTSSAHAKKARMISAPKMLTFESVLKLRWKIWGIAAASATGQTSAARRTERARQLVYREWSWVRAVS